MQKKTSNLALKVIFLGGVGEIGKNMTALEFGEDIMIIDCGSSFPSGDMPGVDLVIPDASYLIEHKDSVRGIVLTHGHEDHIGALPYILKDLKVPVYGTQLTLAILESKLKEQHVEAELITVKPCSVIPLGRNFKVEFVNVSHSIAGSCSLSIDTPIGTVFHTGDFKVDYTPIQGNVIDLARIAEIGKRGVLLLLAESTNIERSGYTMSEATVGKSIDSILSENPDSRIFVATFASNIHRLQQLINLAALHKRKIVFTGRSIVNIVECASRIGELKCDKDMIVDIDKIGNYDDSQLLIITTGSQGEAMSALSRMANDEFPKIKLSYNDLVIISASPIPGNERMVYNVINKIYRHGARAIYESLAEVHVSGHACREEIKLIHTLIKPKFFIPVHGEHRHLKKHAEVAREMNMPASHIIITDIGDVVSVTTKSFKLCDKVESGALLVDGLGIGDENSQVLIDRRRMSEEGLIVVAATLRAANMELIGLEVTSRGFAYENIDESMQELERIAKRTLTAMDVKALNGLDEIKNAVRKEMKNYIYRKTKRNPMIVTSIVEI